LITKTLTYRFDDISGGRLFDIKVNVQ